MAYAMEGCQKRGAKGPNAYIARHRIANHRFARNRIARDGGAKAGSRAQLQGRYPVASEVREVPKRVCGAQALPKRFRAAQALPPTRCPRDAQEVSWCPSGFMKPVTDPCFRLHDNNKKLQ